MKSSLLALALLLGVGAYTPNADAKPLTHKQRNSTPTNRAATLNTQPATINNSWNMRLEQNNNSNSQAETISLNRDPACEKKDFLEYIENPESLLKECSQANKPIRNEPPAELQPPRLDSGVKVNVTQF